MSSENKEMSFWDHLDELRGVLFRSAILVIVLLVVIFVNKRFVFDTLILAPVDSDFILYKWFGQVIAFLNGLFGKMSLSLSFSELDPFSIDLINIELASQFFTHIQISITLAFILSVPFILYQLWGFVKPGLYENEKKAIRRGFGFASILFFLGVIVGYIFIFPLTLRFLGTYQVSEWVANQISLKSYISMFTRLILLMGLVFEMPALAVILSRMGIINKSMLKKYRKHAFIVLLILAAVITPGGDAFTMLMLSLPLYLLYEFSVKICRDIDK